MGGDTDGLPPAIKVTDSTWGRETRWIYYDRETFQIFRQAGDSQAVELVDQGPTDSQLCNGYRSFA